MSRSNQLAGLLTADPPSALDTINEINTALGNDASLSTTLTNSIATKMPLAGGTFTGNVAVNGSVTSTVSGGSNAVLEKSSGGSIAFKQGGTATSLIEDLQSSGGLRFYTGTGGSISEKVRINSSGNVGIGTGTASPADKLELSHNGTLGLRIRNNNNSGYSQIIFGTGSSASSFCTIRHERVGADQGKLHITKPNDGSGGDVFTIDHNGNVGIGTTSPDANSKLHISGGSTDYHTLVLDTTASGGGGMILRHSATYKGYVGTAGSTHLSNSSTDDILIRAQNNLILASGGNNERIRITSAGNVGVGVSPSSAVADGDNLKGLSIGQNTSNGEFSYLQLLNRVENATTSNKIHVDFDHKVSGSTTIPLARISARPKSSTAGELSFSTGSSSSLTERMQIDESGVVYIDNQIYSQAYRTLFLDRNVTLNINPHTDLGVTAQGGVFYVAFSTWPGNAGLFQVRWHNAGGNGGITYSGYDVIVRSSGSLGLTVSHTENNNLYDSVLHITSSGHHSNKHGWTGGVINFGRYGA